MAQETDMVPIWVVAAKRLPWYLASIAIAVIVWLFMSLLFSANIKEPTGWFDKLRYGCRFVWEPRICSPVTIQGSLLTRWDMTGSCGRR